MRKTATAFVFLLVLLAILPAFSASYTISSDVGLAVNSTTAFSVLPSEINLSFRVSPSTFFSPNITIQNNGNVNLSISLWSNTTADTFLGGTSPIFQFNLSDAKPNSCNVALPFADLTSSAVEVCPYLKYQDASDSLNLVLEFFVPKDSPLGLHNTTIYIQGVSTLTSITYPLQVFFTLIKPITVHLVSPMNQTVDDQLVQYFSCDILTSPNSISNLTLEIWNSSDSEIYSNTTILGGNVNSSNWTFFFPYYGNFSWNCLGYETSGNFSWSEEGNYTLDLIQGKLWDEIVAPQGVFEPFNSSLSGTHFSTFSVQLVNLTALPPDVISCDIKVANGSILTLSATGVTSPRANYSLSYTVTGSDSIINDPSVGYIPWVLKNCTERTASGYAYSENATSRIYVHNPVYWPDSEITRAVTCEGTPGVYFNNTAKCDFSQDTMFALRERNGNPVEPSCFNIPGFGCASDFCKGIMFPYCDPLIYFVGYSPLSDDPNGYTTFNVLFGSYTTPIAYTRYVNSSGAFKLRATQALSGKAFSFVIYNLTDVDLARTNVYGPGLGSGTLSLTQETDGTWNAAFYNFGNFSGTLDFVFNISFTNPNINDNRTLKIVIAYGTDTNQGSPAFFPVNFSTSYGLHNNNEGESTSATNEAGGVCGDGVNNDFNYLGPGGSWSNSYDCYDPSCSGLPGNPSQTNEFGSGKTGLCNYAIETNCTDQFDNDYNGLTDCHDASCFHIDPACPATETICNDSIDNDWDYAASLTDVFNSISQGHKWDATHQFPITDCLDQDCNGRPGGPQGQLCNYETEVNCSDGFNNNGLHGLYDCQLLSLGSSTALPNLDNSAKYDCSQYCSETITSKEQGDQCFDNTDNDWDAIIATGPFTYIFNPNGGIDCRWGGYFGYGSNYHPDPDCDNQANSLGQTCQLGIETICNDSFDNSFSRDAGPDYPRAGWNKNITAYENYFNQTYVYSGDYDNYFCKIYGPKAPASESDFGLHPEWCFDGIDNNLDAYYFDGSTFVRNMSTGIDCADPTCFGMTNPANSSQTCLHTEYNATDPFFLSLPNPGMYCENGFDDDANGFTDCRDLACNKQFGMCTGPCYSTQNISWNSCANGIDDAFNLPTPLIDCADPTCNNMMGSLSGAVCQHSGETTCDDGFDNDANGLTDCADPSCAGRIGGEVNGTPVYCLSSESFPSSCFDGFDNDANGYTDCYDTSCNLACNLSTISGTPPISLPVFVGTTAINSVTDAWIGNYTTQVRRGEWYSITMKKTGASTNAEWTLGTAGRRFSLANFDASTASLSGPNAANFAITPTANGFIIDSNHASLPSGYSVTFSIKSTTVLMPISPSPPSTYELTYAEEQGSKTSLNNYVLHEIDEDTSPVAQVLQIVPASGSLPVGGTVYMRANISDNNKLGACDWSVYGPGGAAFTPPESTSCRGSFAPTTSGIYYVNVTPVDYYGNHGTPLTKIYSLNLVPVPASISLSKSIPFYNQSAETFSVNASFIVPSSDSLGQCKVFAKNQSGNETLLATFGASGNSCRSPPISISALADGEYSIFVRASETSEGGIVESNSTALFACSQIQSGVCVFADFNGGSKPDICSAYASGPLTSIISPDPDSYANTLWQNFICSIGDNYQVSNLTLEIWDSNGWEIYSNTAAVDGTANSSSWGFTFGSDGDFTWNCIGYNLRGKSSWGNDGENCSLEIDLTPPAIGFISPTPPAGTTISGTQSIAVAASDSHELDRIEIFIDGASKLNCSSSPCVYPWNTLLYGNGAHTFSANAFDSAGNENSTGARTAMLDNGPHIFCGDGTCNGNETCSTCPGDCGSCGAPPSPSSSSSSQNYLSISFEGACAGEQITVSAKSRGEPVGSALITIYYMDGSGSLPVFSGETSAEGNFSFVAPKPGEYSAVAKKYGYADGSASTTIGDCAVCTFKGTLGSNCTDAHSCCTEGTCREGVCKECNSTGECLGGLACVGWKCANCSIDSQCGAGQFCAQGICVSCRTDPDCKSGESCVGGACVAKPQCEQDSQCPAGKFCAQGVCVSCRTDSDCKPGELCTSGMCVAKLQCEQDYQCPDGAICLNNVCSPCEQDSRCKALQVCVSSRCVDNKLQMKLISPPIVGQNARLIVVDAKGNPVAGAFAIINGRNYTSDNTGTVDFVPIDQNTISLQKEGYVPAQISLKASRPVDYGFCISALAVLLISLAVLAMLLLGSKKRIPKTKE